jgi:hypothetical protein
LKKYVPEKEGNFRPLVKQYLIKLTVVVFEELQHLFQFQHNWISYRSTCEHEKYLWLAKAGPFADIENPDVILADRVESLISQEHAKWITGQEKVRQIKR